MTASAQAVCIIDDDESLRRALRRLMRSVGMQVKVFGTAEEFLEGCPPTPVCLILDQHLPGLTGLELQARLKAEDRAIPIVFISAYAESQVREQALAAGAISFLQKPFKDAELLAALSRAMEKC
jgi:FixJ family two-component response regulator